MHRGIEPAILYFAPPRYSRLHDKQRWICQPSTYIAYMVARVELHDWHGCNFTERGKH